MINITERSSYVKDVGRVSGILVCERIGHIVSCCMVEELGDDCPLPSALFFLSAYHSYFEFDIVDKVVVPNIFMVTSNCLTNKANISQLRA